MKWAKKTSKIYHNLSSERLWETLTDINNWPRWQKDLEWCEISGEFKPGSSFLLKPKGVKAVKIVIEKVIPGESFTDYTQFFGATMYDTHRIQKTETGVNITNIITVEGPLAWLWVFLVARKLANGAQGQMDALVNYTQG